MRQHRLAQHVIVFFLLCLLGAILTFVGLRLYYNDARLQEKLTKHYGATEMHVLAGKASEDNGSLLVTDIQPDGLSFVNIGLLHLDTRFYQQLSIQFADKHVQQPLLLAVRHQGDERPVERLIANTSSMTSDFNLSSMLPDDTVITDIGLLTNQLINSYRIQSVTVTPKSFDNKTFLYLLMDCFAINKQWENWSINTHRSPYPVLIPPKILVLICFTVVGILFAIYLKVVRAPIINAWWTTIIVAWFALDAHYLVEKTVITKNTYDTFAHLSDDEKDLILSPEAAKLAQMIKSVLPDDGKPKKIRIQLGWRDLSLWGTGRSGKRYLSGKLHYILQPNIIYALGVSVPKEAWKEGGFYYVDARKLTQRLAYDAERESVIVADGQQVPVKRLLYNRDMTVYQVIGNESVR